MTLTKLEKLEVLHAAATPPDWKPDGTGGLSQTNHVTRDVWTIPRTLADIDAIAALHNAFPAMAAALREAWQERDAAVQDSRDALGVLERVAEQLRVSAEALAEDPSIAVRERNKVLSENTRMRVTLHFLREKAGYYRSDLDADGKLSPRTDAFRQLVREKEWITDGRESITYCLWCYKHWHEGHAIDCEMFGAAGFVEPKANEGSHE